MCLTGGALILCAPSAFADDRMAGVSSTKKFRAASQLEDYESVGVLSSIQEGALSRDLWQGTDYESAIKLINSLPADTHYPVLQDLTSRLLLSRADASLLENRPEEAEEKQDYNLFSARITKLIEYGMHDQAAALYKEFAGTPDIESVLRAGFMALMHNNEAPIACIDTKIAVKDFPDVSFWQQAEKICNRILLNPAVAADEKNTAESESDKSEPFDSALLSGLMTEKDDYTYKPANSAALKDLAPFERAALNGAGAIDYSEILDERRSILPSLVLGMVLSSAELDESQRFLYTLEAVKRGIKDNGALVKIYKDTALPDHAPEKNAPPLAKQYESLSGWKRLPFLYQALDSGAGDEHTPLLASALALEQDYGREALYPFIPFLGNVDPAALNAAELETTLSLMIYNESVIFSKWLANAGDSFTEKLRNDALRKKILALGAREDLSTEDKIATILKEYGRSLPAPYRETILKIYEKLDKKQELHNYTPSISYENELGLTTRFNYVMPSVVLMDRLKKAKNNKSLGEVVLLSAIILHNIRPVDLYAGTVEEVIDGFVTVGLIREARQLAVEVIAGSSENYKGER